MDKIRICRVITRLNIGGPAQHVVLLASGLSERFETLLVSGREEMEEGNMLDFARAKGFQPLLIPELGREIRPLHDLIAFAKLYRLFKRWRPHIVHTHTAKAGALGRLAARLAEVPIIVHTFHGHIFDGYFSPWKSRLFLEIEQLLAGLTTRIVVLSEGQRQELLRLHVGTPDKLSVLPLGLELDRFLHGKRQDGRLRKELGFSEEERLVGIVGRLVPIKGHALFLQAAKRILKKVPSCRFPIIGDGPLREELERLASTLGLDGVVHFLGWQRDLERIYADLDLCVLSSLNEGTPLSILEAMAAGVPVVAADVGGVGDLVLHNETGLLVRPGDPEALAEAVLELLEDPKRLQEMGEAGRRRAYPHYDVKSLILRMEQFYRELEGGR